MTESTREAARAATAGGPGGRGKRSSLWALLIIALVPILFYATMVFRNWEPASADTGAARPFGIWGTGLQHATGHAPDWCPLILSGMPSYGSFLFTPGSLFDPLADLQQAFKTNRGAWYVLLFILAGAGAFAFFRRQGGSVTSSACAALLFSMTPYFAGSVSAGHSTKLEALCILPGLLLAIDLFLERPDLLRSAFLAAAGAILAWSNHPQIAFYGLLIAFLYAAGVVLSERRWKLGPSWWSRLALFLLIGVVLAVGMAAEPYMAVRQYAPYSIRGGGAAAETPAAGESETGSGWNYATAWSFSPAELISFVFPSWYGLQGETYWGPMPFTQSTHYVGVVALGLALFGLFRLRDRRRMIWGVISAVVLVIGFGNYVPILYGPMYHLIPVFSRFRVPSMIYSTLPLCFGTLIVGGLDSLMLAVSGAGRSEVKHSSHPRGEEKGRKKGGAPAKAQAKHGGLSPEVRRALWFLGLLAAAWILFLVIGHGVTPFKAGEESRLAPDQLNGLRAERGSLLIGSVNRSFLFLIACALLILLAAGRWVPSPRPWLAVALAVLAVADVFFIGKQFYAPQPKPAARDTIPFAGAASFVAAQPGVFRIFPAAGDILQSNAYGLDHLESVGGYHAAKLRVYQDLFDASLIVRPAVLSMLNVRYILSPQAADIGAPALYSQDGYVYPLADSLPRAWSVPKVRLVRNREEMFQTLGGDFHPGEDALLYASSRHPSGSTFTRASVRILDRSAGRLHLEVQGDGPAFVVVSEIYYPPGWVATVDGRTVPIDQTDHVLQGVEVPAGRHEVLFAVRSNARVTGARVSRVCGVITLLVAAVGWWSQRRDRGSRGAAKPAA